MGKTEMMKKFEAETGKQSAIVKFMSGGQALERKSYPKLGPYDYNMEYLAWLEAKAAAYDRLMSGGRKTMKELANIVGKPVACDGNGRPWWFDGIPIWGVWSWVFNNGKMGCLFNIAIDCPLSPKDSLTLPDGWEEK